MTRILQINCSLFSEQGVSSTLANALVERWHRRDPATEVVRRDLATDPIPHLDGARLSAIMTPPGRRSAEQQAIVDEADDIIREIKEADLLVIGAPMYNFSIPSTLKAWSPRPMPPQNARPGPRP